MFAELGGFDLDYFLYMEDEDICLRSWKLDKPVVYYPEAVMTHNHLRGSSKLGKKTFLHLNSMKTFFKNTDSTCKVIETSLKDFCKSLNQHKIKYYERNRISRWQWYKVVPYHQGNQQTAYPYFRQTDDLLSHLGVDACRHQGYTDYLDTLRLA